MATAMPDRRNYRTSDFPAQRCGKSLQSIVHSASPIMKRYRNVISLTICCVNEWPHRCLHTLPLLILLYEDRLMFDIDRFVADCRAALAERSSEAIRDVVRRAVAEPDDPESPGRTERRQRRRGVPGRGPDYPECRLGRPPMTLPHNHDYRAIIGMYGGGEDNIFWRRLTEDAKGRVEAAGAKSLRLGDVAVLGRDIIHSVATRSANCPWRCTSMTATSWPTQGAATGTQRS